MYVTANDLSSDLRGLMVRTVGEGSYFQGCLSIKGCRLNVSNTKFVT